MECRVDVYDLSWLQQLQLLVASENQSRCVVIEQTPVLCGTPTVRETRISPAFSTPAFLTVLIIPVSHFQSTLCVVVVVVVGGGSGTVPSTVIRQS